MFQARASYKNFAAWARAYIFYFGMQAWLALPSGASAEFGAARTACIRELTIPNYDCGIA